SIMATELTEQLDSPAVVKSLVAMQSAGARLALSLFTVTETTVWPLLGMMHALSILGVAPKTAILELLERGLLALDSGPEEQTIDDFGSWIEERPVSSLSLRVHPSVPQSVRVTGPRGELTKATGVVGQIRESDGLEPIVKLAAIWQR